MFSFSLILSYFRLVNSNSCSFTVLAINCFMTCTVWSLTITLSTTYSPAVLSPQVFKPWKWQKIDVTTIFEGSVKFAGSLPDYCVDASIGRRIFLWVLNNVFFIWCFGNLILRMWNKLGRVRLSELCYLTLSTRGWLSLGVARPYMNL